MLNFSENLLSMVVTCVPSDPEVQGVQERPIPI